MTSDYLETEEVEFFFLFLIYNLKIMRHKNDKITGIHITKKEMNKKLGIIMFKKRNLSRAPNKIIKNKKTTNVNDKNGRTQD